MPEEQSSVQSRPTPEALLEMARREESRLGRLRIFVGAAPGVGKTYEMLQTARNLKRDGYDVVVGVVETHGRRETEALLAGLEIVPRRKIDYRGQVLEEMDLEAIIARRPQIVLVDELAHTNAPGSRHPKRFLDVQELQEHGIDVYTTVNVQHIESLNDVIAQITRVRVQETVPDAIFDRADDVKLIDITPEDLIERLKEGKIYLPRQAERALENFFSPTKLTALRELALRRTADRVDDQLLSQMQEHAIKGPWPAGERILVCVSEDPRAPGLVRAAKRMADRLKASWTALYLETQRSHDLTEVQRDRIAQTLRLAQSLGGEAVTLPGGAGRVADDIISYASANNFTQIVIGKSSRSRLFELVNGSVVHDLIRRTGAIGVHVIAGDREGEEPPNLRSLRPSIMAEPTSSVGFLAAVGSIAVATLVAKLCKPFIGLESIDLVFLTGVIATAIRFGLWPSVTASVLASLCYNFFFMPPLYTLTIADPRNVSAFLAFLVVSIVVSQLAARVRKLALTALGRARTTEALYSFSRKLAGAAGLDDVLWATVHQVAAMLKVRVVLLLPEGEGVAVKAGFPPEDTIPSGDLAAARLALESDTPAGRGSNTLPGAKWLFVPLHTVRGAVGVIGVESDRGDVLLSPDDRRLLDALADQAALAIERVHLVADMDRVQRTVEAERLRSALLTSLSHDLKTPLAAVIGTAGTLRDYAPRLAEEQKTELLTQIIDESERLNRFIANLLDMTRLESGAVRPKTAPHDIAEAIDGGVKRAHRMLARHRLEVRIEPGLPMVSLDPVLFEQVIFNLLDNASKYADQGSLIRISAARDGSDIRITVQDEGPGLAPGDAERIFDKFYRAEKLDHVRAGTGLGLAISRGFIEAMRGSITADNRADRSGAVFTIRLPAPAQQPSLLATS